MAVDRQQIMAAVVARLAACPSIAGAVTRSPADFDRKASAQSPVALVLSGDEKAERAHRHPPIWTLTPAIHVYARTKTSGVSPDEQLDQVEKEVEAAFERQPTEATADQWQTSLGGLVERCWVTATTRAQGLEEAEVRIELEILVRGF
jgi:hypothetical protein